MTSEPLLLFRSRRSLLLRLLDRGDPRLGADGAEDEADTNPLHPREAMAERKDGEGHGDHLARDGHGDQQDRGEGREGVDWPRGSASHSSKRRNGKTHR